MSTNRVNIENTKDFLGDMDYWRDGLFDVEQNFEFHEELVGLIGVKYGMKGIAGIFQFFGPFVPTQGPANAQFFQRTDSEIAQNAEGAGVRFFLEYTPEAESFFLAFDFRNKALIGNAELQNIAKTIAHRLMVCWQEIERSVHTQRLRQAGRRAPRRPPQMR